MWCDGDLWICGLAAFNIIQINSFEADLIRWYLTRSNRKFFSRQRIRELLARALYKSNRRGHGIKVTLESGLNHRVTVFFSTIGVLALFATFVLLWTMRFQRLENRKSIIGINLSTSFLNNTTIGLVWIRSFKKMLRRNF